MSKRQQCPSGSIPYTVTAGDTILKIAASYNTSISNIIKSNPGINPDALTVGQQICIPQGIQIYPACPSKNYYVVRPGDTTNKIAEYFNVTNAQLLNANLGITSENLYVDQVICIPVAPSPVNVTIDIRAGKLYVYRNNSIFKTYDIALENPANPVPRGIFKVIYKDVDPGVARGARWIGLNTAEFGIRGSNEPKFIKELSTGGSIVLSNTDVSEFFNLVPVGTTVRVV